MTDSRTVANTQVHVLVVSGTVADASGIAEKLDSTGTLAVRATDVGGLDATAAGSVDCVVLDRPGIDLDPAAVRDSLGGPDGDLVYVALVDPGEWEPRGEQSADGPVVPFPKPSPDETAVLADFVRTTVARPRETRTAEARHRVERFLWDLNDELVEAPTQERVVGVVCERLTESDHFDAVWVCDRPPESAPRASAGFEPERIERLHAAFDGGETDPPWRRAATERESVVTRIGSSAPGAADGTAGGGGTGPLDVASVPLVHRGIVYCVLTVAQENAGERTDLSALVDPLASLGRAAGHAMATTEMQAQSETFQGAIEEAEPAIAILDEDGTVEYVNTAFTDVYGHPKSTAVGSSLDLLVPDDVDAASLLSSVRAGDAWRADVTQKRAGGGRFHADLSIAPVMVEGGTRWKYVAVAADVTDRVEREQRLQVLSRVLRHNVRNGLAVVRGNVEAAAERADESTASLLSTALATTEDLEATATTAREVQAALEETSVREHDLAAVAERTVERARESFPDAALSVSTPDAAPVAAMDALADALWELVENACEHGDDPVAVSVDGDRGIVEVRDDGPGIPDQELAAIERGEETPLQHGSGLGLWFAHWVVEGSGGSLSCSTDDGTTVRVALPAGTDGEGS